MQAFSCIELLKIGQLQWKNWKKYSLSGVDKQKCYITKAMHGK